jgi:glycosyltransferase involved in cell wall biosynthesis
MIGDSRFATHYRRGIKTELHVVGCKPPVSRLGLVIEHGFVSKKTDAGKRLLDKLMSESHFFILPSIADCVPVVLAEASSFGLPCLTSDVDGIPTAIHNGKNGQTFLWDDDLEKYCDYIERFMASRQEYNQLALSSFNEYTEILNWHTAAKSVCDLIQEYCN